MSNLNSQERQRLISMYITQYNQTNLHITRLFNTLDDIRNNINNLIGNNMSRPTRQTRNTRPNRQNNVRHGFNNQYNPRHYFNHRPYIYYDYANPIDRSTYVSNATNNSSDITNFLWNIINNNTSNINEHDNNPNITNFLTNFLNSVPVRPTQEQINNASRLIRYSDIQTPNSTSCAISLEAFTQSDNVRQLNHCGHIFFPDQFNQWFSNNVRCPVCRHDIRNTTSTIPSPIPTSTPIRNNATPTTAPNNANLRNINPVTNIIDQLTVDLSTRLLTDLFSPSSNTNRFTLNPSSNEDVLLFETIIRPNNNNSS
jgi:hypothetical protein